MEKTYLKGKYQIGIKQVLQLGFINAIAGMSDSFLYAFLPVYGTEMGFTPMMVGVLLSMNRFVRLFTNQLVAYLASVKGVKKVYIWGTLLSFIVSLGYAAMPTFVFWVILRALWGLSFSILRFSKLQYVSLCNKMGAAMGLSASIGGSIQIIAFTIGPLIIAWTSEGVVFLVFALLLLVFAPLLLRIPEIETGPQDIQLVRLQMPGKVDLWGFLTNFSLDGILIVGLSSLLKLEGDQTSILFSTALFISIRRGIGIVFAPIFGIPIDRMGLLKSFWSMLGILLLGLALVIYGEVYIGLVIIFIGATANQTLAPLISIQTSPPKKRFSAVTGLNNSQDLGSAFGALFGLSLVLSVNNTLLFSIIATSLLGFGYLLGNFIKTNAKYR